MSREHKPIVLNDFRGLYSRGEPEMVPPKYLIGCLNKDWDGDILATRKGSDLEFTFSNIRRIYEYRRIDEAPRWLVLNTAGQLYDLTVSLVTPILTIAAMTDFSAVTIFNRCYITPHNRVEGLPGEKLYIYDGLIIRPAGGLAPTGTLIASILGVGKVEAGIHLVAVVFETESGYLTKPGPAIYAQYETSVPSVIRVSDVPIGPAGTVKRHLIATKAIEEYDGNQDGYAYYFVPDGTIDNNVDTVIDLDFYDADLFISADFLFEQLDIIPAGLGLTSYAGRLVLWGEDGNNSLVRVSRAGEPESLSTRTGFIIVAPEEAGGVKACVEFRDSLYILKSARTYQTSNNGNEPGTWPWIRIDAGIGCEVFGIGTILDAKGSSVEAFLVASKSGLRLFNGTYIHPELTYNIEGFWKRINPLALDKVQVSVDPIKKKIYALLPLDANTEALFMLMGDFSRGLSYNAIRWSLFSFPTEIRSILGNIDNNTKRYTLTFARASNIYSLSETVLNDDGVAIPIPTIRTHFMSVADGGEINHFGMIHLRVKGSGTLSVQVIGLDGTVLTLKSIVLSPTSGVEIPIPNAFVNEKMQIKLEVSSINAWFRIIKIAAKAKILYTSGPA